MDLESTGLELFDDPQRRASFEAALRKVGYRVGSVQRGEENLSQVRVGLVPFGRGPSFALEKLPDADEHWGGALLLDAEGTELASFDFSRSRHYKQSCFDVWIAEIVAAVRTASRSTSGEGE